MPFVMSVFRPDAGADAREYQCLHHDPGQHELQVLVPVHAGERAAEEEHEQRREDDRLQCHVEQLFWIAADADESAPGKRSRVPRGAQRSDVAGRRCRQRSR